MVDASRYPIQVFWSEADEGFIATRPICRGALRPVRRRLKR